MYPYTWGRGSWRREEDGQIYTAVERAYSSETQDISGTYHKVSDMTDLLKFNDTVEYQFIKYMGIEQSDFTTNLPSENVELGTTTLGNQAIYIKVTKLIG